MVQLDRSVYGLRGGLEKQSQDANVVWQEQIQFEEQRQKDYDFQVAIRDKTSWEQFYKQFFKDDGGLSDAEARANLLKKSPLFDLLSSKQLVQVAMGAKFLGYSPGEEIV